MRVLISAYACGPESGSEVGNGWNWSVAMADAGHAVTVLTKTGRKAALEAAVAQRDDQLLRFRFVPTPRSSRTVHGQAGVYARYLAWQLAALREARRLTRTETFDVVHHISWGSLQLGTWLGLLPIPLVFGPVGGGQVAPAALKEFHAGNWSTEALRSFVTRRLILLDPFARIAARRARIVLVNNPETEALVRRLGGRDVRYLSELGVAPGDVVARPPADRNSPLHLLWVGRLMPRKGLYLALEAVAEARRKVPVHLTVVGGGPQEVLLDEWTAQLGIADIFEHRGHVPRHEVTEAYRSCDALLFTSLRDTTGAQVLEAMAAGVPVITLRHSGAGVLVDDTRGLLVEPRDPASTVRGLAEAITVLARDPAFQRQLSQGASAYASTQLWGVKAQQMTAIYREALTVDGAADSGEGGRPPGHRRSRRSPEKVRHRARRPRVWRAPHEED
jgi:glycosyltransferase involved in cell wall biosynthesis